MFGAKAICDGRIALLSAVKPFSMIDVNVRLGSIAAGNEPGLSVDMPMLTDARGVSLARLPTEQFMEYFRRRSREGIPHTGNLLACVCGDTGSFGMLRMFGILAELEGIRPEKRYFVSQDLSEVSAWMAEQVGMEDGAADRIAAEVDLFREELRV